MSCIAQLGSDYFPRFKSLQRFMPPVEVENRVREGHALLLTHCSPKAKRISREASLSRNELVVRMAKALLVLSAPKAGSSLELAKAALNRGKPVLSLERGFNEGTLRIRRLRVQKTSKKVCCKPKLSARLSVGENGNPTMLHRLDKCSLV